MSTDTVIQRIQYCVDVAARQHPDNRLLRTETFIAALAGVLQRDDLALSNQVFALLNQAERP